MAVPDALDKTRYFVFGCSHLTIAVDYIPLLRIFGDRSLEEISNAKLRNLNLKTFAIDLLWYTKLLTLPRAAQLAIET